MGRDVYFMRLAFGRSSHEPPLPQQPAFSQEAGEGPSGQIGDTARPDPQSQRIERHEDIPLHYRVPPQQYNSRGHPVNPQSRIYGRRIRAAANDILSVVGVVERKNSDGAVDSTSHRRATEDAVGIVIDIVSYTSYGLATWWINIILTRLLAYPSAIHTSFWDLALQRYREVGPSRFFFVGIVSYVTSTLMYGLPWNDMVVYLIDRLVIALTKSRKIRNFYQHCRPYIQGALRLGRVIVAFPFRLHSVLQALDIVPADNLFPPLHSLKPFSPSSPLHFGSTPLATLLHLAYQPIYSQTRVYITNSLDLPSKAPLNNIFGRPSAHRRQPHTADAQVTENSDRPSLLASLAASISSRWSSLITLLSRDRAQPSPLSYVSSQDEASQTQTTAMPTTTTSTEETTSAGHDQSQDVHPEPAINTEDTPNIPEDGSPISTQPQLPFIREDATIRISSIDAVSGTVNLEIGFPEDFHTHAHNHHYHHHHHHHHNHPTNPSDALTYDRGAIESSSRRSSSGTAGRRNGTPTPSDLAAEPFHFFIRMNSGWLTQVALLPLQAIMYRGLAVHFSRYPWPGRPTELGFNPFSTGLRDLREMGFGGLRSWLGKVGLCLMLCRAIGFGVWMLEWGVVVAVGKGFFGWGDW